MTPDVGRIAALFLSWSRVNKEQRIHVAVVIPTVGNAVGAIVEEKQMPSDVEPFFEINAIYFSNPEAARALVDEIADGETSIT